MDDVLELLLLLLARLQLKLQQLVQCLRGFKSSSNSSFRRYLLRLRLRLKRRVLLVQRRLYQRLKTLQLQLLTAQRQFIASCQAYRARLTAPSPCVQTCKLPTFAVVHIRINCWRFGASTSIQYISKRPDSQRFMTINVSDLFTTSDLPALYAHRVFDMLQFEKILAQARVADMTQRAIGWFKRSSSTL
eukprot:17714-Heterococcus_DN1.PRE.1